MSLPHAADDLRNHMWHGSGCNNLRNNQEMKWIAGGEFQKL